MTIKVIDLLNRIANGEEVPEKINWNGVIWEYNKHEKEYYSQGTKEAFFNDTSSVGLWLIGHLNDEVEIIEEEPEIEEIDVSLLGDEDNWIRKYNLKKHIYEQYTGNELNPYIIHNIRENTIIFQNKINELIRAIKQLDKQIKEK